MADDTVTVQRAGDRVIIGWSGDVDAANVRSIEERSLRALHNSDIDAVLDLSGVTYLDSAGIRTLLSMHRALAERQQSMCLVLPETSLCRKAVTVAGLDAVMPIVPTLEDATGA